MRDSFISPVTPSSSNLRNGYSTSWTRGVVAVSAFLAVDDESVSKAFICKSTLIHSPPTYLTTFIRRTIGVGTHSFWYRPCKGQLVSGRGIRECAFAYIVRQRPPHFPLSVRDVAREKPPVLRHIQRDALRIFGGPGEFYEIGGMVAMVFTIIFKNIVLICTYVESLSKIYRNLNPCKPLCRSIASARLIGRNLTLLKTV